MKRSRDKKNPALGAWVTNDNNAEKKNKKKNGEPACTKAGSTQTGAGRIGASQQGCSSAGAPPGKGIQPQGEVQTQGKRESAD